MHDWFKYVSVVVNWGLFRGNIKAWSGVGALSRPCCSFSRSRPNCVLLRQLKPSLFQCRHFCYQFFVTRHIQVFAEGLNVVKPLANLILIKNIIWIILVSERFLSTSNKQMINCCFQLFWIKITLDNKIYNTNNLHGQTYSECIIQMLIEAYFSVGYYEVNKLTY